MVPFSRSLPHRQLRNMFPAERLPTWDHCRIGSLENILRHFGKVRLDHCRIGSLETGR